jgi:ABC-2 type transport system permease protein
MLRSVWLKVLHDQWRLLLGMSILAGALAGMYLAFYPSIGMAEEMQALLDSLPPALMALFASQGLDLSTPEGFLNMELFSFLGPIFVMIYAATVGAGATAGEEERGTLDLLLANPVPRWRVVVEKAGAMIVGLAILSAAMLLGVVLVSVAMQIDLDAGKVAGALASNGLLGLSLGSVALLIGGLTGRRMMAVGVTMTLAVVSFFVNGLAPLVDWLAGLRPWSLFYHFIGYDPLNNGLDPLHAGVLLAVAVICGAGAALAIEHRDLVA